MANNTSPNPPPHLVIVPSPAMGHLIPLGEFGKRVAVKPCFTATFVIATNAPFSVAQKDYLESLPQGISHMVLPPVDLHDLPFGVRAETRINLTIVRSLDRIRAALNSLKATTRLVAMVVDLFGTDAFDVAKEFNISPYMFYPSPAMVLSLFLYLPKLDESTSCEYRDLPDPVQILGCIPVQGSDLLDPVQDRKNDAYKWLLHHTQRYRLAEGIMVNTFKELEPEVIRTLQESGSRNPPIYPVGPLVKMGRSRDLVDKSDCLEWLDGQPNGSVLFISFGSSGMLSLDQITELALGLELSVQKFCWKIYGFQVIS